LEDAIGATFGFPAIGSTIEDGWSDSQIVILGGDFELSAEDEAIATAAPHGTITLAGGTVNLKCWANQTCMRAAALHLDDVRLHAVTSAPQLFDVDDNTFGDDMDVTIGYRRASIAERLDGPCLHFGEIDAADHTVFNLSFLNGSFAEREIAYNASDLKSLLVSLPPRTKYSVRAKAGDEEWMLCDSQYSTSNFDVDDAEAFYQSVGMCTNHTVFNLRARACESSQY
jgi:hypothetical protein